MSWCSKWLHGSEWPEGVEVTLGYDGNMRRYVPEAENAKLREELEFEREDNASIRRLFDAIAPRCGKPDCPSLVAYVEKLRELVRDLHKALFTLDIDHCQSCPRDNINGPCTKFMLRGSDECSIEEDMRELGIEVSE